MLCFRVEPVLSYSVPCYLLVWYSLLLRCVIVLHIDVIWEICIFELSTVYISSQCSVLICRKSSNCHLAFFKKRCKSKCKKKEQCFNVFTVVYCLQKYFPTRAGWNDVPYHVITPPLIPTRGIPPPQQPKEWTCACWWIKCNVTSHYSQVVV